MGQTSIYLGNRCGSEMPGKVKIWALVRQDIHGQNILQKKFKQGAQGAQGSKGSTLIVILG